MFRVRTQSLHVKFILILLLAVGITVMAGFIAAAHLRIVMLRNTAQAVAEQVTAFRSWVAGSGVVWVDTLQPATPDYLGTKSCGSASFYSKNPALATRELSAIVAQSSVKAAFRVTSDNFRNVQNKPDVFERAAIDTFKSDLSRPLEDRHVYVENLDGDKYRFAVPVTVTEPCLRCHGSAKDAPREVVEKYGSTRAFGYKIGDIRGVISVDLPVQSLITDSPIFNWCSLALIAAAFVAGYVLLRTLIIDRIKNVIAAADGVGRGKTAADFSDRYLRDSKDEIDALYRAIDGIDERISGPTGRATNKAGKDGPGVNASGGKPDGMQEE